MWVACVRACVCVRVCVVLCCVLYFVLSMQDITTRELVVEVWDSSLLQSDTLMGEVRLRGDAKHRFPTGYHKFEIERRTG